ncbi:unnamed protein product [Prorocentrum cordatum]|uniref:Selenoprotein O n=1 Tax=Prorocentrum cordatum TaxID=2364126 RepID=A0ABN9XYA6_9DINO|nr:unnamed protein product [Polarella glacialis]|mmetsp:Transcript_61118/g.164827  ORF Transcript_61118/g.164827 Transcript_61118/m.164827 type:complete len:299 (+) Transcript_61118:160-1056(+)
MNAPEELEDPNACTAIVKNNAKAPLQLVRRLACVSETDQLGPMEKSTWCEVYNDRIVAMGGWPADLKITRDFELDFAIGGHFKLVPPIGAGSEDSDPMQHKYEGFQFLGKNFPFTGPLATSITGAWKPQKNWDHNKACVEDPLYPKLATEFATFLVQALQDMLPRMTFPTPDAHGELRDEGRDPKLLEIEDSREVASPGPKVADASSPASSATECSPAGSELGLSLVGGVSDSPRPSGTLAAWTAPSPMAGSSTARRVGIRRPESMSEKKWAALQKLGAFQAKKQDSEGVPSDAPGGA